MELLFIIVTLLLIILSLLPFIDHPHWFFRVPEFIKLQLVPIQFAVILLNFVVIQDFAWLIPLQIASFGLFIYHGYILIRYTKFWRNTSHQKTQNASTEVKVIVFNVYQFNRKFHQFIDLIEREQPAIFLTMESNADWEKANRLLEKSYPNTVKVTLENTYGMHLYSRLDIVKSEVNYYVADDIPSIEAEILTEDGQRFVFIAVHPPPPSPTEESTSKERDGELQCIAKRVSELKQPVIVAGDFNNVAWAKSSLLFKKTSELIDARIGRGFITTFHAKYWIFRVPLDLLFHSCEVFINVLKRYDNIGSDHFPVGFSFYIDRLNDEQEDLVKTATTEELEQVDQMIEEGKQEESDNRKAQAEP